MPADARRTDMRMRLTVLVVTWLPLLLFLAGCGKSKKY
jgi:hypothetical protein